MLGRMNENTGSLFLCLTVSLIFALPSPVLADSSERGPGGKLLRGVVNASTGWIEIFQGIYDVSVEKGPVTGVLYGPIFGLGMVIVRTGSGIYETITFPIPFPSNYQSTIEPEYVWDHWGLFGGLEGFTVHKDPDSP